MTICGISDRRTLLCMALLSSMGVLPCRGAEPTTLHLGDLFQGGLSEMPYDFGRNFAERQPKCFPIYGAVMLTPEAIRVYVFKDNGGFPGPELEASNAGEVRRVTLSLPDCRVIYSVRRQQLVDGRWVPLMPADDSGLPGAHGRQIGSTDKFNDIGAAFPSTAVDCGSFVTALHIGPDSIDHLTTADNFHLMSNWGSDDHMMRLTTSTDACETVVDIMPQVRDGDTWHPVAFRITHGLDLGHGKTLK